MVLLVVTVAILMLSLAGLAFVSTMSTEHKAVRVQGAELQLATLVGSGEQLLGAFFEQTAEDREAAGGHLDNPGLFRGVLVFDDERSGHRGRFSIVSPLIENDEITGMRFGVADESARLNLGVLPLWEQQSPGAGHDALMQLPGMTDSVADAILDWIDSDTSARQFGAEEDFYVGLNLPYAPRNAVPSSLEELLLVRGVTRDLLFGADANFNYQLETEETRAAQLLGGGYRPGSSLTWASLLTVHSAERNLTPQQTPRIHLNDPDLGRLHQQLSERFDTQTSRFVIWYRQFGPYRGSEQPGDAKETTVDPMGATTGRRSRSARNRSDRSLDVDLALPGKFQLDCVLDLVDARVRVPLPPARSEPQRPGDTVNEEDKPADTPTHVVVASPLGSDDRALRGDDRALRGDNRALRDLLPELLDQVSVSGAEVIRGRINVNLATRPVLAAVPGLELATVEQIVARRRSPGASNDPNFRHATWLLTEGLVDLPRMKALMPYLTAGGDVFRAQIVGFFDDAPRSDRVELVIDATRRPPRQVYWKNLRLLGNGYPLQALGAKPPVK